MYKKLKKLVIPEDDPFKNDKLQRKQVAENLTKIITTSDEPLVLSLNAPWGFGKTTFVEMWRQDLKRQRYPSIYFNAWEYDYATNPFHSFLGEIQGVIDDMDLNPKEKGEVRKIKDKLIKNAGKMFRKSIPLLLRLGTGGLLNLDERTEREISKSLESYVEEAITDYHEEKKTIKNFKEALEKFGSEFVRINKSYKLPIIVFVDELDRCRPSYAIELLENIKHLFSVKGYVFVLSLDREQLAHSVKSVYGQGMDADGYLRRFIDLEFNMPDPERDKLCKYLLVDYFDVNQYLIQRYGAEYGGGVASELLFLFMQFSESFNLSLRNMGQIAGNLSLLVKLIDEEDIWGPIFLLLFLKINDPETLRDFKHNLIVGEGLASDLEKKINNSKFLNHKHWLHVKAFLICIGLESGQAESKANHHMYGADGKIRDRESTEYKLGESIRTFRSIRSRKNDFFEKIKFSGNFLI